MASYPYSETFIVNAQAVNGAIVTAYNTATMVSFTPSGITQGAQVRWAAVS
jgi:hypothetical protein